MTSDEMEGIEEILMDKINPRIKKIREDIFIIGCTALGALFLAVLGFNR